MRKKVEYQLQYHIRNGVKRMHRTLLIIIGEKGRGKVVNLHDALREELHSIPKILWCHNNKPQIEKYRKRTAKRAKKWRKKNADPQASFSFILFYEAGGVSFCEYKDSHRIVGNSYGMIVLQDCEALTPNILARTIETVEGGGLVVMLLNTISSLASFNTMAMDIHDLYRTEAHSEINFCFNQRFILSLASCNNIVMDDDLNVTDTSIKKNCGPRQESEQVLMALNKEVHTTDKIVPLVELCSTLDQAKAVVELYLAIVNQVVDKTFERTVALVGPRGRGKSSALGIALVGAIEFGFSNICVTAPTPENLKTLFEFVCKGLKALKYEEHRYHLVRDSTPEESGTATPESRRAIVGVTIKQSLQKIQYILPSEHQKLAQAELLVVDGAAAFPVPVIRSLLGSHMVFLSSTTDGYEGTCSTFSLKLLKKLEKKNDGDDSASLQEKEFCSLKLQEPIRYAVEDPLENWLNDFLCLDVTSTIPPIERLPLPSECDLYYVNRKTLFSFQEESEVFLKRIMALYVTSNCNYSPDDLQSMADAPAHHLFVLLGPVDESQNVPRDILCVIQVCLEGHISAQSVSEHLKSGSQPLGDEIPWMFCKAFEDTKFPSLLGARVLRIAVHPSALRKGYGSAAMDLLIRYYEGKLTNFNERERENVRVLGPTTEKSLDTRKGMLSRKRKHAEKEPLPEESIVPAQNLPPLYVPVCERSPEIIDYMGASFGYQTEQSEFWKKHKFFPFYVPMKAVTIDDISGEQCCMAIRPLTVGETREGFSEESGRW